MVPQGADTTGSRGLVSIQPAEARGGDSSARIFCKKVHQAVETLERFAIAPTACPSWIARMVWRQERAAEAQIHCERVTGYADQRSIFADFKAGLSKHNKLPPLALSLTPDPGFQTSRPRMLTPPSGAHAQ